MLARITREPHHTDGELVAMKLILLSPEAPTGLPLRKTIMVLEGYHALEGTKT